ncbi:hypothetical protein FDECE_11822 [Fusarium decemcellulare]|nr:hypothetical protein FDECE_11822 [Fusarium decemcellulare]
MSGVEIAGLVLGAIPVAIETLKICGHGLSAVRKGRMYENELERLTNKLENERVRFQDVCEKLLIDLVPPSRVECLITDPLGLAHEEPGLERKLQRRLWKSYNAFEAALRDVKAALDEAQDRIDSQKRSSRSDFRRALRRLFLDDLLSRVNEGVSTIEEMTNRGIELEPARKTRFQGRFLHIIRAVAGGVYHAIRESLNCQCKHDVCLQLEQQICNIIPADEDDDRVIEDLRFRLVVSYDRDNSVEKRSWRDIMVRTAERRRQRHSSPPPLRPDRKGKKLLRFAESLGFSSPATACPSVQTSSMNLREVAHELTTMSQSSSAPFERLDLCATIRQPHQGEQNCYGWIAESAIGPPTSYTVHPNLSKYRQCSDRVITSLNEMLGQNQRCILLSEQDRLQLAVVLSSSFLQLYGSPWVPAVMRSQDVYLVQSQEDPICDRFFVLQSFPHTGNNDKEPADLAFPRNQTLFYLAFFSSS